jgi:hypothetical protein
VINLLALNVLRPVNYQAFMYLKITLKSYGRLSSISAEQAAILYKNHWQIELFFKWIMQHLKIKAFWGTSENAVRIQIFSAIIAYCLVAIIRTQLKIERSTYEILQVLG